MSRTPGEAPPVNTEEDRAMIADLMASPEKIEDSAPADTPAEVHNQKIVIVKIPSRYFEDKVEKLLKSMESQFTNTGYKVIYAPEEVDIYFLEDGAKEFTSKLPHYT